MHSQHPSRHPYAELSSKGVRAAAKQKLSEQVAKTYKGKVTGVYLTEFVMQ